MKTIKQWLEELPEPYRTQALFNMENYPLAMFFYAKTIDSEVDSLDQAVDAFDWEASDQGFKYWEDFNNTLLN